MGLDWIFPESKLKLTGVGMVSANDAQRQTITAAEIIHRLREQPGVILADEVGMGKTFVAFAVAVAVVDSSQRKDGPVMFLVPSHMVDKWFDDWNTFCRDCVVDADLKKRLEQIKVVETVPDLLRETDKSNKTSAPVVLMKLSAFTHRLQDRWFKLALIRACFRESHLSAKTRRRFVKWAPRLLQTKNWITSEIIDGLLRRDSNEWKKYLQRLDVVAASEDVSIPDRVETVNKQEYLEPFIEFLRYQLPGHKGKVAEDSITFARREMNDAISQVYKMMLRDLMWRSPLVVLDEAHHLKNPKSRAHSIFADRQETENCLGYLDDTFERMLFLTATPFQLGHHELINVLKLFGSVRWQDGVHHSVGKEKYNLELRKVEAALDDSQRLARRLDKQWGELAFEQVVSDCERFKIPLSADKEILVDRWWNAAKDGRLTTSLAKAIVELIQQVKERNTQAEELLRPLVIRHSKPKYMDSSIAKQPILRRVLYPGAAINPGKQSISDTGEAIPHFDGIVIEQANALPFLLSIRAQTELARIRDSQRAYFAEGLASSYEAFHHTSQVKQEAIDEQEDETDDVESLEHTRVSQWYISNIKKYVPGAKRKDVAASLHPKIAATVARVVDIWEKGEKVLVFVFYLQTASALRTHLTNAVQTRTIQIAAARMGHGAKSDQAGQMLNRIADRLERPENALAIEINELIKEQITLVSALENIYERQRKQLSQILFRFVTSDSFIARYFPINDPTFIESVGFRRRLSPKAAIALRKALDVPAELAVRSPLRQIQDMLKFLAECRSRKIEDLYGTRTEFDAYLDALRTVRRGDVVRMVTGAVLPENRAAIMRAFNTPLFPEILVASQIMAEGVDLQRSCRFVIHHDLNWNPSVLEQRIGRVDRLGSLSAQLAKPLHIFEPYLSSTADEKMYKVVKDRARWFQIVMGEQFDLSEASTDQRAQRVPFPQTLASELTYDLAVVKAHSKD